MSNGNESHQLASIEKRLSALEKSPKDKWDKFHVLASILIPAAVVVAGYYVSVAIKEAEFVSATIQKEANIKAASARSSAEITSAEKIAEGNKEVAKINASVAQAKLIHDFLESLTKKAGKEKTLAVVAVSIALPEEVVERLLLAIKEDKSTSPPVRKAAENILKKLRNGETCSEESMPLELLLSSTTWKY